MRFKVDARPQGCDIDVPAMAVEPPRIIALAGNPNVGKSTIFNALTGLKQHTGNWPGKTVASAQGRFEWKGQRYELVDLPGCYSLHARSAEEEVARDFLCFDSPHAVIVVCDATCLERNLNLVLQTLELCPNALVCINLLDEARRKCIQVDLPALEARLGVPVVGTAARDKRGLDALRERVAQAHDRQRMPACACVAYPEAIEQALRALEPAIAAAWEAASEHAAEASLPARWLALRLLEGDSSVLRAVQRHLGIDLAADESVQRAVQAQREALAAQGFPREELRDQMVASVLHTARALLEGVVRFGEADHTARDRRIDRALTSRWIGFPAMFLALLAILWLTVSGSNTPSALLGRALSALEPPLSNALTWLSAPDWLRRLLVEGVYRVLAWVVSVMLPPMAIFFPLFTLLEDAGYLPRVAFNLDRLFHRCDACGKQALTMCMGLGCNAVGVTGCRIIDSPRERLIAILTNAFVPCNGRFPTLIALISMFFVGTGLGGAGSFAGAALLGCVLVFSIGMTLAASKLLSRTVLRGTASSFALELPPYRRPQLGKVLVRSLLDRTLFVLGRAAMVAAPAGLVLWLLANITVGDASLLAHCAAFLDPLARPLGMDGVILLAFVLGLPANEIVLPIMLMAYTAQGGLQDLGSLAQFKALLVQNGWTWITAVNVLLFSLLHWPCSTTCLTIHHETRSLRWTALAIVLPTLAGALLCLAFTSVARWLTAL